MDVLLEFVERLALAEHSGHFDESADEKYPVTPILERESTSHLNNSEALNGTIHDDWSEFKAGRQLPKTQPRRGFPILAGKQIMMLHAFVKKSAKTPTQELKIARDRMKEVNKDADT